MKLFVGVAGCSLGLDGHVVNIELSFEAGRDILPNAVAIDRFGKHDVD